jgi:hypothetical protein
MRFSSGYRQGRTTRRRTSTTNGRADLTFIGGMEGAVVTSTAMDALITVVSRPARPVCAVR